MSRSYKMLKKKLTPLIITFLVMIPINVLFLGTNNDLNVENDEVSKEDKADLDAKDDQLALSGMSALSKYITFYINRTEMYENNTFYCYVSDILNFTMTNHSRIIGSVDITVIGIGTLTLTNTGNDYILLQQIDLAPDLYTCKLTYLNKTSAQKTFYFYLRVNNFGPMIYDVKVKDSSYNPYYMPIAEGGIVQTYRDTTLELEVYTRDKDNYTRAVWMNYTDGFTHFQKNITSATSEAKLRTFDTETNGDSILITINTSKGFEDAWKPKESLYKIMLDASNRYEDEGEYLFEFFIEIMNQAPIITKFDFKDDIIASPNPSWKSYNVTLMLNASDLEDDKFYFNGDEAERVAKYSDPIYLVANKSNCNITSGSNINLLNDKNPNTYYELAFKKNSSVPTGAIIFDFYINAEVNLTNLQSITINTSISDDLTRPLNPNSGGGLEIFDFISETWTELQNLGIKVKEDLGSISVLNNTITSNLNHYIAENRTLRLRILYGDSTDKVHVRLRDVRLTLDLLRRETFSTLQVGAYGPNDQTPSSFIEIINNWKASEDLYYYTYEIPNIANNYGSWTFWVSFMDHGSRPYRQTHWGNFSILPVGSSSPRNSYNYDYNEDSINEGEFFASASLTKIFCFGVPSSEALKPSTAPQFYDDSNARMSTSPLRNDKVNVSINVQGIDTSTLYNKTYEKTRYGYLFQIQKNATSVNSSRLDGYNVAPTHNLTGHESDVYADDAAGLNGYYSISVNRSLTGNWRYHTVTWSTQVENKFWINKQNITQLNFDIDNWWPDTTNMDTVFCEFYNYTSNTWVLLDDTWKDSTGTNLKKTSNSNGVSGNRLIQTIEDQTIIEDIVSYAGIVQMRLRISVNLGSTNDYILNLDMVKITSRYNNNYTASLTLKHLLNGASEQEYQLKPYRIDASTMQYSTFINISKSDLYAEVFVLYYEFQNGNSTVRSTFFRKAPRIMRQNFVEDVKRLYYYNKNQELTGLGANYTLYFRNARITCASQFTLNQYDTLLGRTINSLIMHRTIDRLNLTGTLDLKTLKDQESNINIDFQIQFKMLGEETTNSWMYSNDDSSYFTYDHVAKTWQYLRTLDSSDFDYSTIFCRIYMRNQFGEENFTAWKTFRVQNFRPTDLRFNFYGESEKTINRSMSYTFKFSFIDYDMTAALATGANVVKAKFQVFNKTGEYKWINSTSVSRLSGSQGLINYTVRMDIPKWVKTGEFNQTYINWILFVNDTNYGYEEQISLINYNFTKFIVKNNAPYITGFTTDATNNQVLRQTNVQFSFKIIDADETNANLLEIIYFNITSPTGPQLSVDDNNTILYNGISDVRYYLYTGVTKDKPTGIWTVSIKLNDTDHRITTQYFTFTVVNNVPVILSIGYFTEDGHKYNNVTRDIGAAMIIRVNVSDVENVQCKSLWINLRHRTFSETIRTVSPTIEPYTFNLSYVRSVGSTQIWKRKITFNTTINAEIFFAGNLSVQVNVTDYDGATTKTNSSNLIILNSQPVFNSKQVTELGMTEAKAYYMNSSVVRGGNIEVYIFASDLEGISHFELRYDTVNLDGKEVRQTLLAYAKDWEYNSTLYGVSVSVYILKISTSQFDKTIIRVDLDDIYVYDIDHGYKSQTKYGYTLNYMTFDDAATIDIVEAGQGGTGVDLMLILMIAGPIVLGGVAVAGVFYWRKKRGWRRFMD